MGLEVAGPEVAGQTDRVAEAQAAHSESELATDVVTLPESLKGRGYATAFLGMWNLGRGQTGPVTPGGQGFDTVVFPENLGFAKDASVDADGNQLSDRLTDEALAFVKNHRRDPFFVYFADHAIQAPYDPEPSLLAKYERKAATIEAVDLNADRIVERLAKLGHTDDTLVVFTSDNGGTSQYTPPLKGGKGELFEGGIRVPLVAAGAGVAKPGKTCDVPVASVDFYQTLLELAGGKPAAGQTSDTGDTCTLGASVTLRRLSAASLTPGHSPCDLARGPWHIAPPPKPGLVEAAFVT